jgi:hypothetical protein
MTSHFAKVGLLVAVAVLAFSDAGMPQPAPPAPAAGSNAPVPFQMTMGDMMNTLIQPRHAKLGLAGKAENWPLAGYAAVELRQAFTAIPKSIPRFRGLPVAELVEAAVGQPIKALTAAIKQRDAQKFAEAYGQLTQGCNACHATANHPFVVIKAPDASNFPNQDFSARQ